MRLALWKQQTCALAACVLLPNILSAQGREPGQSIGTVAVRGNLIVMTLREGALGSANLFDLVRRTLRFTPDGSGYRVENLAFQWDPEFGSEMAGSQASLKNFSFPFSGRAWNAFSVGVTGSISFGDSTGGRGGGLSVARFAELREAARGLLNTGPAIAVFFKPRMTGKRSLKELDDRAVITWSLTEPFGGIQDMYWAPTVNRFQAVLRKNGVIEMSYDQMSAQDAIVGVYPVAASGAASEIASLEGETNAGIAPHLGIRQLKLAAADGLFLRASLETSGPLPADGDAGAVFRICIHAKAITGDCSQTTRADAIWSIQGRRGGRGGRGGAAPYVASGEGVTAPVKLDSGAISIQGILPPGYKAGSAVFVSAAVQDTRTGEIVSRVRPVAVKLTNLGSPEVDLSSAKKDDGPFPAVFESFRYLKPPRAVDLTCTVLQTLGDKFDFLAYYSDFRIDNPEAGTSSSGPLGGGPAGGAVTGIGAAQRNLSDYCTQGRFQWQYIQPVYVGANQMQKYPPEGFTDERPQSIGTYTRQLALRTSDGKIPAYDYAMSQLGHEMGHRWSAFVSAKIGAERIPLGPTHWARGLHAPVPFPYQRPIEASAMGGSVWQDNYDGTFTQLDDDYYVPATGWSYLDLYLMGLAAPSEVPDFFLLRDLTPAGRDANGRPIFKADRTRVTVQDVIAAEGPRVPDVYQSQKNFNTGMVVVVEHGKTPSRELLQRTEDIRLRWLDYWETTTGHRSTMTANPK